MNRRLCGAAVFVLAVAGFAASEGRAQVAVPAGRSIEAAWQAERAFHLTRIMERARTQIANGRIRVEIGTLAPLDIAGSEKALADLEALVAADARRTDRPARPIRDIAAMRTRLSEALNNLDAAEIRFDNGMITTREMDAAYSAVVRLLLT